MPFKQLPRWAVFVGWVVLSGCAGSSSPEAAFEGYRTALTKKDWKGVLDSLTPESQDRLVGEAVVAVRVMSCVNPTAAEILRKHGFQEGAAPIVPGEEPEDEAAGWKMVPRSPHSDAARFANTVADKPAFFADAMDWIDHSGKGQLGWFLPYSSGVLSGIEPHGDTATARVGTTLAVIVGGTTVKFQKIGYRWYLQL